MAEPSLRMAGRGERADSRIFTPLSSLWLRRNRLPGAPEKGHNRTGTKSPPRLIQRMWQSVRGHRQESAKVVTRSRSPYQPRKRRKGNKRGMREVSPNKALTCGCRRGKWGRGTDPARRKEYVPDACMTGTCPRRRCRPRSADGKTADMSAREHDPARWHRSDPLARDG